MLPPLSDRNVRDYYERRSSTKRSFERSYNFHAESYVDVSSLKTNVTQSRKARLQPLDCRPENCDAAAVEGIFEGTDQLSCTDLPQQWRIPRWRNIRGCPLHCVEWRKVKEGATSAPKFAAPKERRVRPRNRQQQEEAKLKFARELLSFDPENDFAKALLLTDEGDTVQSRFGLGSSLSPQSYQQSLLPHGFTILLAGLQPADECHQETIPTDIFLTAAQPGILWHTSGKQHSAGQRLVNVFASN
ncbi:hypothetical protein MTO96_041638 [Rhipicephalus appendiculatus]